MTGRPLDQFVRLGRDATCFACLKRCALGGLASSKQSAPMAVLDRCLTMRSVPDKAKPTKYCNGSLATEGQAAHINDGMFHLASV